MLWFHWRHKKIQLWHNDTLIQIHLIKREVGLSFGICRLPAVKRFGNPCIEYGVQSRLISPFMLTLGNAFCSMLSHFRMRSSNISGLRQVSRWGTRGSLFDIAVLMEFYRYRNFFYVFLESVFLSAVPAFGFIQFPVKITGIWHDIWSVARINFSVCERLCSSFPFVAPSVLFQNFLLIYIFKVFFKRNNVFSQRHLFDNE